MMDWLQQNLLAVYGAVVGTIALILNFGRFWLVLQRGKRKLRVEANISDRAQAQLDELAKPQLPFTQGTLIGPIFDVAVINCSHVHIHVQSAGIIVRTKNGKEKIESLIRNGSQGWLSKLSKAGGHDLPAGARHTFHVWFSREESTIPEVVGCYVTDQLGKEYHGKISSNEITLTFPNNPDKFNM